MLVGGDAGVTRPDAAICHRYCVWATGNSTDRSSIDRETVQALVSALHGVSATKGVFISISAFTQHAKDCAFGIPTHTILIDGNLLGSHE